MQQMPVERIHRFLDQMKRNANISAAGIVGFIGMLSVSALYPLTVTGIVCFVSLTGLAVGMVKLHECRLSGSTDMELNKEAAEYMTIQQGGFQKKLAASTSVWLVITAVLVWFMIYMRVAPGTLSAWELIGFYGVWIGAAGCFPVIRNFLCLQWMVRVAGDRQMRKENTRLPLFMGFSAVYWMSAWIIYLRVDNWISKWNVLAAAVFLYAAGFLAVNLLYRDNWLLLPYITTVTAEAHGRYPVSYDDLTGVYSIQMGAAGGMRILQLTDIHLGGSFLSAGKDKKALEAVLRLIRHTAPDLVVVTGDFVFPLGIRSFSFNNYAPMVEFAAFMRNIGIPWAFTYGNHDTESVASHTAEEINRLLEQFSYKNTSSLLYSSVQPSVSGRNNQMIQILNQDGSINQVLFLLDSNSYASKKWNDYDCIHDDQVAWYQRMLDRLEAGAGRKVSSLLFFHVPLQEYKTAYDLYRQGSPEVTYHYGQIGERHEAVCCSMHPSRLFDTAVRLGSTKGMFVGHDHYNNISLDYKNIRLTYGLSIDYLAMRGISKKSGQRGGTLITLYPNSDFTVRPVRLDEI